MAYTVALREKGKSRPFCYVSEDLRIVDTATSSNKMTEWFNMKYGGSVWRVVPLINRPNRRGK